MLCVVAHPDDEVLGCGGTLAKHAEAGDDVQVMILARRKDVIDASQTNAAFSALGLGTGRPTAVLRAYELPDQAFDTVPFVRITRYLALLDFEPDIVYTHNPDDLNLDHALTAKAVLTAFRAPHSQADILAFETLSSTEFGPVAFQPNHWEILTRDQVAKKCAALNCYPSEKKPWPHSRNSFGIDSQARWRGLQICQPFAEAFRILRSIR